MGILLSDVLEDGREAVAILRKLLGQGRPVEFRDMADQAKNLIARIDARDTQSTAAREALQLRRAKRRTTGRKNSGAFRIAPAQDHGCDHGVSGIILAEKGETWLVWRSGGTYWSGRQQHYAPAELEIRLKPSDFSRMPIRLTCHFEAGKAARLSRALILKHAAQIDKIFGEYSAATVAANLKHTVTLS